MMSEIVGYLTRTEYNLYPREKFDQNHFEKLVNNKISLLKKLLQKEPKSTKHNIQVAILKLQEYLNDSLTGNLYKPCYHSFVCDQILQTRDNENKLSNENLEKLRNAELERDYYRTKSECVHSAIGRLIEFGFEYFRDLLEDNNLKIVAFIYLRKPHWVHDYFHFNPKPIQSLLSTKWVEICNNIYTTVRLVNIPNSFSDYIHNENEAALKSILRDYNMELRNVCCSATLEFINLLQNLNPTIQDINIIISNCNNKSPYRSPETKLEIDEVISKTFDVAFELSNIEIYNLFLYDKFNDLIDKISRNEEPYLKYFTDLWFSKLKEWNSSNRMGFNKDQDNYFLTMIDLNFLKEKAKSETQIAFKKHHILIESIQLEKIYFKEYNAIINDLREDFIMVLQGRENELKNDTIQTIKELDKNLDLVLLNEKGYVYNHRHESKFKNEMIEGFFTSFLFKSIYSDQLILLNKNGSKLIAKNQGQITNENEMSIPEFSQIDIICNILFPYFKGSEKDLESLIKANITPKSKLIFSSKGKTLLDFFKQLVIGRILIIEPKADLEKWICNHFKYTSNRSVKDFTQKYCNSIISSTERAAKNNRLIDIKEENGQFVITLLKKGTREQK